MASPELHGTAVPSASPELHGTAVPSASGLVLRISICSTMWPQDALKTCQLVPRTWTVVEARGPSDVLDKFPTRNRMKRKRRYLIWLLDERETEGESLWQLLEEVERGLRVGVGGPYR